MSQNKSGIKIIETEEKVMIRAGEDFAKKSSNTKEILHSLELDTIKRVSLLLSSKSKNFRDTFFLIRQKIIEERLEYAQISLTTHSGPVFKQRVDENDELSIHTANYIAHSNPMEKTLEIQMTRLGKMFAEEDSAQEVSVLLFSEKPEKVSFTFIKGEKEKDEDYRKRISNLERYFLRKLTELSSVLQIDFMSGRKEIPFLLSSYTRKDSSYPLVCIQHNELPRKHIATHLATRKKVQAGNYSKIRI